MAACQLRVLCWASSLALLEQNTSYIYILMSQMKNINQVKYFKIYLKIWRSRFNFNKQAVLLLLSFSLYSMSSNIFERYTEDNLSFVSSILIIQLNISYYKVYTFLFFILSGFLSAWLTGWRCRLVDIVFIGMIITGVACLVGAILSILASTTTDCGRVCTIVLTNLFWILLNTGLAPVNANIFQLVIEQIPEASSSQLSSSVSWFIFFQTLGYWLSAVIICIFQHCIGLDAKSVLQYSPCFIFINGAIFATVLSTYSLLKHKLVDNSPTSNTVSHIYQVVKYAIKHRRPVQRSAMTYWEDEIPGGMNLGKKKYGGPFTSEQVEDVKTFFRMVLLFLLGIFYCCTHNLCVFSLGYIEKDATANNTSIFLLQEFQSICTRTIMYNMFDSNFWTLLSVLVYEFIVMPILHYRMPSVRWKLRFAIFLGFLICLSITIITGIYNYLAVTYVVKIFWLRTGLNIVIGITHSITAMAILEFILAQTPYTMRNFFINIYFCNSFVAIFFSKYVFDIFNSQCKSINCPMIYSTVSLSLNFAAMLLFLIAITRYRMRSRGHEDEHQQRWIEEIYDKYLEQVDT